MCDATPRKFTGLLLLWRDVITVSYDLPLFDAVLRFRDRYSRRRRTLYQNLESHYGDERPHRHYNRVRKSDAKR